MENQTEYLSDGIAAFEAKHFAMAAQILSGLAEAGEAEAQFRMAVMQQNGLGMVVNLSGAFANMQKAAAQGHDLALHGLGFMYYEGEGVTQDFSQAMDWFEKAAAKGLTGSMMTLSTMYAEGQGMAADAEKAEYWMNKAMQGNG